MHRQKQTGKISIPTTVFLLLLTAATAWFVLNRQYVVDMVRAARFTPSEQIAKIQQDVMLTDKGKQLYRASEPMLETSEAFNANCNQKSETNNPILGCYTQQKIFVYDVTNPKLEGIEQTTAAHELLHAVYERMGESEKKEIDTALKAAYETLKTDELVQRMKHYGETEPGAEMNELHSILGTEFENLGDTLENHYRKFFIDRSKIVGFAKQYSGVFAEIKTKLKTLSDTINTTVESINKQIAEHNAAVKQLQSDQADFLAKNRRGEFTNAAEFNAVQRTLNQRATKLNTERDTINARIDESNTMRDEYNALVKENNELNKSMNSSLAPKPSL